MVGGQVINLVITFLPAAADAVIQVNGESSVTVASLRNAYISSVIFIALIYGVVLLGVHKSKKWARWATMLLAVLAAAGGFDGLARIITSGSFDVCAFVVILDQLIALCWLMFHAFICDL